MYKLHKNISITIIHKKQQSVYNVVKPLVIWRMQFKADTKYPYIHLWMFKIENSQDSKCYKDVEKPCCSYTVWNIKSYSHSGKQFDNF
jgi:hypothetical protein